MVYADPFRKNVVFDEDAEESEQLCPICVLNLDEEQKQWTAVAFMKNYLGLSVEAFPDPFHVRSNGHWRAIAKAGLSMWAMCAMLFCNMSYGPWGKGKNYSELQEYSHHLVSLADCDEPALVKLWPIICNDKGWSETDASSPRGTHIVFFLQSLFTINVVFPLRGRKQPPASSLAPMARVGFFGEPT